MVPSEYEGFGFPAAEAMACEVAVVSTSGALPEVVGDAGIMVPCKDAQALMREFANSWSTQAARPISTRGPPAHFASFNWDKVAVRLTDYYHDIRQASR